MGRIELGGVRNNEIVGVWVWVCEWVGGWVSGCVGAQQPYLRMFDVGVSLEPACPQAGRSMGLPTAGVRAPRLHA